MALHDDDTIPNDALLYRVLHPKWITVVDGRPRPNSLALLESNFEASLFLEGEGILAELRRLFPQLRIASVPALIIRQEHLVIERRPNECPEGFGCDSTSHVVVGPNAEIGRNEYQRRTRAIARNNAFVILPE
jgi:hypothetical protein